MTLGDWLVCSALFVLSVATSLGQQSKPAAETAPVVQPGAPGQSSRVLTSAAAAVPVRAPSAADVSFMQGMIMHHSQAVEMTDLMKTRGQNKRLLALGERIS